MHPSFFLFLKTSEKEAFNGFLSQCLSLGAAAAQCIVKALDAHHSFVGQTRLATTKYL